jgi:hypothetical protein
MVLVVEKKFLEEDWWKYPLAIFLLHFVFWILLGYKINPTFTFGNALSRGELILTIFLSATYLPFVAGRLQLRTLFWFGFVGLILALAAYYALSLLGAGKSFGLLPLIGFLQTYVACFGLGILVEFGAYVFRKLGE